MDVNRSGMPRSAATDELGPTALCGHCATLIRYHPAESVWRHCIAGLDHAPQPYGAGWQRTGDAEYDAAARPAISESEARALDGNR